MAPLEKPVIIVGEYVLFINKIELLTDQEDYLSELAREIELYNLTEEKVNANLTRIINSRKGHITILEQN